MIENWDDLNITEDLLKGIYRKGFEKPTPIQSMSIQPIIDGKDVIAQSQSGTGKTGSFVIGALSKIDTSSNDLQVLIVATTHELVKQIHEVVESIGNAMEGLNTKTLVGGTSIMNDIQNMKEKRPHIIIGTVGRIYDMLRRKVIFLDKLKLFIMDEADELLSKGFKEQIHDLFLHVSSSSQVALFSATIPNEVLNLSQKFMRDPVKIILKPEELSLECIQQYYIALNSDNDKYETLKDLFSLLEIKQTIIYVNNITRVNDLYDAMTKDGYPVCYIHSSMEKGAREEALNQFKMGKFRVLISSGITARGIDIQQVSIVINFDIIRDINTYLHAIGRSGRYGRKGLAINFVTKQDIFFMRKIESHYKIDIKELPTNVKELI